MIKTLALNNLVTDSCYKIFQQSLRSCLSFWLVIFLPRISLFYHSDHTTSSAQLNETALSTSSGFFFFFQSRLGYISCWLWKRLKIYHFISFPHQSGNSSELAQSLSQACAPCVPFQPTNLLFWQPIKLVLVTCQLVKTCHTHLRYACICAAIMTRRNSYSLVFRDVIM